MTVEQLTADREIVWAAIMKGTGAQKIAVLGRVYERPALSELRALLNEIEQRIAQLTRGGKRVRLATPQ